MTINKMCVAVTVHLYMDVESDISVDEVVNELDYHFADTTDMARVVDSHIERFDIISEG